MRCSTRLTVTTPSSKIPLLAIGGLLALAACGGTTHTSADAQSSASEESMPPVTAPVAPVVVGHDEPPEQPQPTEPARLDGVDDALHTASAPDVAPLGPDPEEPVASSAYDDLPAGIGPLETGDGPQLGEPVPFEPTVQAFEFVDLAQPTPQYLPAPQPSFEVVTLNDDDPLPGDGAGELTLTAATGCADHCIADATISSAGGSSSRYDLRVDVESPASVEAYLSLAPIERNSDGRHVVPFSVPTASGTVGFFWTTSFDLDPSTEYHLLVRATDEQGTSSVAGSFTTAEAMGPDQLVVPMPCADGCLEWVETDVADDGTEIAVTVEVDTAATVELAWSSDPFVHDADGHPTLVDPSTQVHSASAGSMVTLRMLERLPNTVHNVMITATDPAGGVDRMVGAIATPSPAIAAGIANLHINGDGDDGRFDWGEIRFQYGTVGPGQMARWGYRDEQKIASNTTVTLNRPGGALRADGSGRYPSVILFAGERDGSQVSTCFTSTNLPEDWRPDDVVTYCGRERTTWSNAWVPRMTLAEIEQLPSCEYFDNIRNDAADRCALVETPPNGPNGVSFKMTVWFDVDF